MYTSRILNSFYSPWLGGGYHLSNRHLNTVVAIYKGRNHKHKQYCFMNITITG